MRFQTSFSAMLLLLGVAVSAQQKSAFVKPVFFPSANLFSANPDSLALIPVSLESAVRNFTVIAGDPNLPGDYNWRRDVSRIESTKLAAFQQGQYDRLHREMPPEMTQYVTQKVFVKDAPRN